MLTQRGHTCVCVCVSTGALQALLPAQKHAEPDTKGDTTPNNDAECLIHPQECPGWVLPALIVPRH